MIDTIKLHNIIENSTTNGPDNRFVIWTQGCSLNCDGCFNQSTHDLKGGFDLEITKLAEQINQTSAIRGITLTGGEPLLQSKAISQLLNLIDNTLDILLFSGYTFGEIKADSSKLKILHQVDAALLGRYNKELPHPFYGKKLVLNGNRIKKEELKPWLNTEVIIQGDNVQITGLYKQSV
ncbi:radical SAM protein [bacterium]|nr:radical SAM protein [bacterium]MBR2273235.1 radical SAM protein [Alphaproteobacteria bacterium]